VTVNLKIRLLDIEGDGKHLLVNAKVNGKAARLLIDTGASRTVFDLNRIHLFEKGKKPQLHSQVSSGLGTSTMESHTLILKSLQFGKIAIKNYATVLLDLSHVNDSYKRIRKKPIDGVIGSDLLLKYKSIIDYRKMQLQLASR
jgi:predicted aspartyl protease